MLLMRGGILEMAITSMSSMPCLLPTLLPQGLRTPELDDNGESGLTMRRHICYVPTSIEPLVLYHLVTLFIKLWFKVQVRKLETILFLPKL